MLRKLKLTRVGPGASLVMDPIARRFNLITGDNGLGKSFLLDVGWWALTRTWHESPAVPNAQDAEIAFAFDGERRPHQAVSKWLPGAQTWRRAPGRPPNPGLVLYARVDGSFSAWDPARNYRLYQRPDGGNIEAPPAYQFSPRQVFHGLRRTITEGGQEREQTICSGLILDWILWQRSEDPRFELLRRLLAALGPEGEPLRPGEPRYPYPDDDRAIPTVSMPYGQDVPITYAPAGVQRMCKLAYLLAWSLSAHERESASMGRPMSRQLIVLIDEPETHLHPRWQRTVLRGIHEAVRGWHDDAAPDVQFLVATHSPLILASMEPVFDPSRDALWKLDLVDGMVQIAKDEWHLRGDASRWLRSDVFDLGEATSVDAERAIEAARRLIREPSPDPDRIRNVDADLGRLLPAMDPFFVRWRHFMSQHLPPEPA
ncbi:AAA family ATPase [Myxococcota bacterium]|nr:AAA family ATPase [Myxococcota bacterium]